MVSADDIISICLWWIFPEKYPSGILDFIKYNIIVLVDEADRSQEGELGQKMRDSLPNAFLFGLTGTPVNKKDRNTFLTFGAKKSGSTWYKNPFNLTSALFAWTFKILFTIYFKIFLVSTSLT